MSGTAVIITTDPKNPPINSRRASSSINRPSPRSSSSSSSSSSEDKPSSISKREAEKDMPYSQKADTEKINNNTVIPIYPAAPYANNDILIVEPKYHPSPYHIQPVVQNLEYNPPQNNFAFMNVSHTHNDRKAFIKKVYALLSMQLLWTSVATGIVVGVPVIRDGIKKTTGLVIAALVITIIIMIAIFCYKKVARKYPINYIALFLFTFFETYIISYICAFYDPYIVMIAAIITTITTFALTVYAFRTSSDFTFCRGSTVAIVSSFFLFGFFMIFFHSIYLRLIYCEIAIIIYSFFIVYDTQMIAGGKYQEIGYDDYIIGSLILYVDVVGLFLYILSFLGAKK